MHHFRFLLLFYLLVRVFFAFFFGTIFTTKVNIFATAYTQARLGANRIYTIIQSQPTIVTGDVKKLETVNIILEVCT